MDGDHLEQTPEKLAIQNSELYPAEQTSDEDFIVSRLGKLVLDEDTFLREHQKDAFNDVVNFYRQGGRETYVKLPTSTGKTVIFVELCKSLMESVHPTEEKPRIIVLAPTKDLVDQTVGSIDAKTGKRKGFKGFAPELEVRSVHSGVSSKAQIANLAEAEVLVTTYNTFRNLIKTFVDAEQKTDEDYEAEKLAFNHDIQRTRDTIRRLEDARTRFLHERYVTQEVGRIKNDVGTLLEMADQGDAVSSIEQGWLESLAQTLEDNKDETPEGLLYLVRNQAMSIKSERMDRGIAAIKNSIEKTKRTVAERRAEREKKIYASTQHIRLERHESETAIEEGLRLADLSEAETMLTWFLWRHRPGGSYIKRDDLSSREDRAKFSEMSSELAHLRSQVHDKQSKIKALEWQQQVRESVSKFELIVCDEAHRVIGSETWRAVRDFAALKDIAILGLTATDEYFDRSLEDYFEEKAHELTKQEAMKREIVNPLALFVHNTGLRFQGVSVDASGDYDRLTIRQMRFSEERNLIGVNYAKMLSEHGYRGIMSAIPGDEGEHAKELASLINQQYITDPETGEVRKMRARYVLNTTKNRAEYYRAFEAGEIDWLTFVDVIREGWDSDRAKAIINMRPTRSPLLATQRLGRIGRTHTGAPVSVAVDLYDGLVIDDDELSEIPPVLATDVFELDDINQGHVIGSQPEVEPEVFSALRASMPDRISAHHTRYVEILKDAVVVDPRGIGLASSEGPSSAWATFDALQKEFQGYLPKDVLLEAVKGDNPSVRMTKGRRRSGTVTLFNISDVRGLYADKPEINPWRLYIDDSGEEWITPEGCTKMLSKRFPRLRAEQIIESVSEIENTAQQPFDKTIGRVLITFGTATKRYGFARMYKLNEVRDRLVPYLSARSS